MTYWYKANVLLQELKRCSVAEIWNLECGNDSGMQHCHRKRMLYK